MNRIWVVCISVLWMVPGLLAQGLKNTPTAKNIPELLDLTEDLINYSPDSCLVILNLIEEKIAGLKDRELAEEYLASYRVRLADYWLYDDTELSKKSLDQALNYFQVHPDYKRMAELFCIKAQVIKIEGKNSPESFHQSIPIFNEALTYALQQDNPKTTAFIYYENAITLQQAERWQESLEYAFKDLHYAQLSGDSLTIGMAYFLMGRTYNYFGFAENSEYNISKAIEYAKGMYLMHSVINTYAIILLKNGKLELALENFNLALKMSIEMKAFGAASRIYTEIGRIQLKLNQFEEAMKSYDCLSNMYLNKQVSSPSALLFMAQIHCYTNERASVLEDLDKFVEASKVSYINSYDIDLFKEAADLYYSLGHIEESSKLYKKWGLMKDSLQSFTNKVQLKELEKLYFNERARNEEITLKNEELSESRSSQATMAIALIVFLIFGGGLAYFIRMKGLKENQKLKLALKERQLEQFIEVQEMERVRIARELHDGIGQSLAALKMQMQIDDHSVATEQMIQQVDGLCKEVRTLSHQMMPIVLREHGLENAVEQLLNSSFNPSGIEFDFVTSGLLAKYPEKVEIHVYRIVQELIANVLKHSKATKVGVQLLGRPEELILIVEDNGIGFQRQNLSEGIGISNIYSRVEALAGKVNIQSSSRDGSFIRIAVPNGVFEELI